MNRADETLLPAVVPESAARDGNEIGLDVVMHHLAITLPADVVVSCGNLLFTLTPSSIE